MFNVSTRIVFTVIGHGMFVGFDLVPEQSLACRDLTCDESNGSKTLLTKLKISVKYNK